MGRTNGSRNGAFSSTGPALWLAGLLLLLFLIAAGAGHAHEREDASHPLTPAGAGHVLDAAEWLISQAREREGAAVEPLAADVDAAVLTRWLAKAGGLADRSSLEEFREYLGENGFETGDHDPFIQWLDGMERVLAAFQAIREGAVGADPEPLWAELQSLPADTEDPAARAQIGRLRRQIGLAAVPDADADATRPYIERIERLIEIAKEWDQ